MEYGDNLYHWGVKGMKWGVRRYQNADGSLTGAGRRRYQIKDGVMSEKGKKRYDKDTAALKAEKKHLRAQLRTTKKMEKLNKLQNEAEDLKKKTDDVETPEAKRERLLKSTDPKELYENRSLLSTAELNDRINRIDTEARLSSKISVELQKSGMDALNEKMQKTSSTLNNITNTFKKVDEAYSAVTNSAIGKTLAKKLGIEPPKKEFNLDDALKKMNKMTTQEVMDLNKRMTATKSINKMKAEMDAEKNAASEAKRKQEEAQKQVDDYNRKLYEETTSRSDSSYRMKGRDVTDGRTRVSNPKPSPNTLRLETVERYETTGRDIIGKGTSKFKGFDEPPTQDAVYNGEKYVSGLLGIEDKGGK